MRLGKLLIARGFIKTVEHGWVNLNCVKNVYQYGSKIHLDLNDGSTIFVGNLCCADNEETELDEAFTDKGNP